MKIRPIMFHYVYALESLKNKQFYADYTTNLKRRLSEHNQKKNFSTKHYASWRIIHVEAYLNEKGAKRRENYLKTSQGMRLLKRMLKEYLYESRIFTARKN